MQHWQNFAANFRTLCGLFAIIILCSTITVTFAAESEKFEARFRKLSNELRCPTCQGLSVKDSEAGFSNSIKDKIRELIKHKKTDKEIRGYFIERYGEWILRAPPKKGFNLVLWILPGAGIVIGLLWVVFRSKSLVTNSQHEELAQLTSEEEQKLKEDLKRFEES